MIYLAYLWLRHDYVDEIFAQLLRDRKAFDLRWPR